MEGAEGSPPNKGNPQTQTQSMSDTRKPQRIQRLDERVVNRIAAGEVVQRPSNAVKELLENSLDAGATNINIVVKDGGLKMLQITDNGCGIAKEDLPLACERFATSKLRKYEDLESIATHGFRGEALASVSHVAHVTITTKTAASNCAWKASYADGKLIAPKPGAAAEPKPCAGNDGTQILVEDLFFNMPMRLKAIKQPAEEYNRILEVVTRYAVHNAGRVALSLKKIGSSDPDVSTVNRASKVDNIRALFGAGVARELLEIGCDSPHFEFQCSGYISNPNFNMKKMTFVLFINNRLVESSTLKRAIESVYSTFLPKNTHPFAYVSLTINPHNVDVNVHPTKREVQFLHEDAIVGLLVDEIGKKLASAAGSRTYSTKALAPAPRTEEDEEAEEETTSRAIKVRRIAEPSSSSDAEDLGEEQIMQRPVAHFRTLSKAGGSIHSAPPSATRQQTQMTTHFQSKSATLSDRGTMRGGDPIGSARPKLPPSKLVRVDPKAQRIDTLLFHQNSREGMSGVRRTAVEEELIDSEEEREEEREEEQVDLDDGGIEGDAVKDREPEEDESMGSPAEDEGESALKQRDPRLSALRDESQDDHLEDDREAVSQEAETTLRDSIRDPHKDSPAGDNSAADQIQGASEPPARPFVDVQLTSVLELRQSILDRMHRGITEVFRDHTFVGIVDSRLALVQHQIRLYMINYREASRLLFEQLALKVFSNCGRIHLSPPMPIAELLAIALEDESDMDEGEQSKEQLIEVSRRLSCVFSTMRSLTTSRILHRSLSFKFSPPTDPCWKNTFLCASRREANFKPCLSC